MMSDRYSMWVRYWYDTSYDTGTRYDRYDTKEGMCSTRTDAVLSLSLSLSLFSLSFLSLCHKRQPREYGPMYNEDADEDSDEDAAEPRMVRELARACNCLICSDGDSFAIPSRALSSTTGACPTIPSSTLGRIWAGASAVSAASASVTISGLEAALTAC